MMTRLQLIEAAAQELLADMQHRYPETVDPSTIRCEFLRALLSAVTTQPSARDRVYEALDSERDYQDKVWAENAGKVPGADVRTVAEELLMLEEYVAKARSAWTVTPRASEVAVTTDILRKCGGIVTRALENHGAPKRGS